MNLDTPDSDAGRRPLAACAWALLLWATFAIAPRSAAADAQNDSRVLATVGARSITEKEVESRIKSQLAVMQSQIYELKRKTIQSIADDYLLGQAAFSMHMTVADFLTHRGGAISVSDDDARKYYDQHRGQYHQPYEEARTSILGTVLSQREEARRQTVLAKLRGDTPLKVMMDPPRVELKVEGHPERGPADAPITLVEFADFQCPFCSRVTPTLKGLREKYGDQLKLVYFDFPLQFHAHAMDAAKAARCAGEQNKFWEYHDALFANQGKLLPADLKATAAKLGLDGAKFAACLDHGGHEDAIRRDAAAGRQIGVTGTPAFFIDGRPLTGAQPQSEFEGIIDDELSRPGHAQARAAVPFP
jgi:protein-disulfide isomerase